MPKPEPGILEKTLQCKPGLPPILRPERRQIDQKGEI